MRSGSALTRIGCGEFGFARHFGRSEMERIIGTNKVSQWAMGSVPAQIIHDLLERCSGATGAALFATERPSLQPLLACDGGCRGGSLPLLDAPLQSRQQALLLYRQPGHLIFDFRQSTHTPEPCHRPSMPASKQKRRTSLFTIASASPVNPAAESLPARAAAARGCRGDRTNVRCRPCRVRPESP